MKYLKKVETLPSTLEEGVLYYDSTNDKVALKKAEPTPTYEYVDLGLPSGTLWATCNIGASKPEEYGLYFQWGDTVGYEGDEAKAHSIWETAPFNNGSSDYDETYFASVSGTVCPNGVLAAQYDAASVATSGLAHMPTTADTVELVNNTTNEWVTDYNSSGVNGYLFTSKTNGKTLFIPAAGYCYYGNLNYVGYIGSVWSSSLYSSYPNNAYHLNFRSGDVSPHENYGRCNGYSVRAVRSVSK